MNTAEINKVNEDVILVSDVLKLFGDKVSYKTVLALVHEKRLPATKVGNSYIFSRKAVTRWLEHNLGICT